MQKTEYVGGGSATIPELIARALDIAQSDTNNRLSAIRVQGCEGDELMLIWDDGKPAPEPVYPPDEAPIDQPNRGW